MRRLRHVLMKNHPGECAVAAADGTKRGWQQCHEFKLSEMNEDVLEHAVSIGAVGNGGI